jgi:hypothetical protein
MKTSFNEKRQINKLGLETFFLSLENNSYDSVITKIIDFHEKKIIELRESLGIKFIDDSINDEWEIMFLEQELKAVTEMKIIYAYKDFEIKLKFLISASYQKIDISKMYKWDFIIDFLKTRSIDLKNVDSYSELEELRNVNNALKHSNIFESKVLPKEFKNKKIITYKDILAFYSRIEEAPKKFLINLSSLFLKDLYEFDDNRINKIADRIALRMDKKNADLLIKKIQENY